jgi:colanic acid/amylovoran biosynthesis protein
MAYNERPDTLGTGLGVKLRVAWYSDIDEGFIEKLRSMLLSVAAQLKAPLLSVPISRHPEEQDQEVCDRLFDGYAAVAPPVNDTILTEGLMREIGRCRTVVTTSYHGGVFSLSQGVPIVAWIKSKYFASKLLGLANQFGVGCTVISLDEPNALDLLKEAILTTYASAETFRPQLLAAAEKQIALSKAGYERAFAKAKSAMASASGSR